MAAPKKPQDRKPAADAPIKVEVRGTTFTIDRAALDDFELLDDLARVEDGAGQRLPSLLRRLLGGDYGRALDLIRDEDTGRVSLETGAELVQEIFEAVDPS